MTNTIYLNRLNNAESFAATFSELRLENKAVVNQVAQAFVGQSASFRTKKAALTAIEEKRIERVRFQNQLNAVR